MCMNYEQVTNAIITESRQHMRGLSDTEVYNMAIELLNDVDKADSYMTSEFGGYTQGQLNKIKYDKYRQARYYQSNKALAANKAL